MNSANKTTQLALIGTGSIARHHLETILPHFPDTIIPVVCEPSEKQFDLTRELFGKHQRPIPVNITDLDKLLETYAGKLDAAFINTPHVFHFAQAKACLEAGVDVLLEKPMVMNGDEAQQLIDVRDATGRLLVVAFQGSLSPQIRQAAKLLRSGEMGKIQNISATIWQDWQDIADGTWRANPAISGGGFLFDSGAHMLNTVADLAGEEFQEVAAWLDKRNFEVELNGVVIGRLASGALVTLNGCGLTIETCASDIRIFGSEGIIRTSAWGRFLEIQRQGEIEFKKITVPEAKGVWEQFLAVRSGKLENPSPPEVGLRMARLWDAINKSAAQGGRPVAV